MRKAFIIYRHLVCCTLIGWTLFDITSEEHDFHKCQEITSDAYSRNLRFHRLSRWRVMKGLYRSTSWHLWSLLLWNTNQSLQGHKRFMQSWLRILISTCPLVVKHIGISMEMQTCSFSGHIRPKTRKAASTMTQPHPQSGGVMGPIAWLFSTDTISDSAKAYALVHQASWRTYPE